MFITVSRDSLSLSLSKYDPLQGFCLQMAPTLQTFDAEKLSACFPGISKWNLSLSLHLSSLNNLRGALFVVMKSLLQTNTIITPQFVHIAIHRGL